MDEKGNMGQIEHQVFYSCLIEIENMFSSLLLNPILLSLEEPLNEITLSKV